MFGDPIIWYLLVALASLVAFPLAYHLFPALSDRGYTISRALGLLLWGYIFWMLSSLGVFVNTSGGILAGLVVLAGISFWAYRKIDKPSFTEWLKNNRRILITTELLFAVAFLFALFMRAMEPAVFGTEKPMELAFLNGILRSPRMPPLDPWLADYSISYYYFGYLIIAMLAKLGGTSAGVAFNLGISLVFGLAAIGAYGLIYNLLAGLNLETTKRRLQLLPLLGPLFILILSNLEGFLEFIHGRGAFWTRTASGEWVSRFWAWVDIEDLIMPPPGNTAPGQLRHWWWWRASRVLSDYDILRESRWLVIDEFPFFSFFLADLHPHVLVIPFVLLALGLSLNMFLQSGQADPKSFRMYRFDYLFSPQTLILGILVFGGLGFLNLWDFPWHVGIFAGLHLLRKADLNGWSMDRLIEFLVLGLVFGIGGVLAYLPFYLSFSSQAGGIMPNIIHPTRGVQLWVMFGALFLPIFAYLLYLVYNKRKELRPILLGLTTAALGFAGLFGLSLLLTNALSSPNLPHLNDQFGNLFLQSYDVGSVEELFREGLSRRWKTLFSGVTLTALIGLSVGLLWPRRKVGEEEKQIGLSASHRFVIVMVIFGSLLVLIPEFFYLRDFFRNRMNTVFKFYYQAWILWALAGAYGSAVLFLIPVKNLSAKIYPVIFAFVMITGLTYPIMALNTRVNLFQNQPEPVFTLDGTDNSYYLNPDEHAAAEWLLQAPLGTMAEAIHPTGGSYTDYARISMNTGQPAVLGWIQHENQWRGGMAEIGSRQADIERLYTTGSWEEARQIIEQYGIVYIVVGNLERSTYNLYEDKFIRNLEPAFQQGGVTIYYTGITP